MSIASTLQPNRRSDRTNIANRYMRCTKRRERLSKRCVAAPASTVHNRTTHYVYCASHPKEFAPAQFRPWVPWPVDKPVASPPCARAVIRSVSRMIGCARCCAAEQLSGGRWSVHGPWLLEFSTIALGGLLVRWYTHFLRKETTIPRGTMIIPKTAIATDRYASFGLGVSFHVNRA